MATFKTQSFSQRLSGLKATFNKTIQSSQQLVLEMDKEVELKNSLISKLDSEVKEITETRTQTTSFINNLQKLVE
jgi:predicted house-cleaning noncanonical NTP pyrophosphatase (MazG superfamily)